MATTDQVSYAVILFTGVCVCTTGSTSPSLFHSTMPVRPSRYHTIVTSSTMREYSGLRFKGKASKRALKVSQVVEEQRQLKERQKNEELCKFLLGPH